MKLILTIAKYVPQVYLNWKLKSTVGWSIYNVLLDFGGGIASIAQLLLDAYRSGHLQGIEGTLSKLLLGAISVLFDVIFMLQHYVWYPSDHILAMKQQDPEDFLINTENDPTTTKSIDEESIER
jgi:cystinosin